MYRCHTKIGRSSRMRSIILNSSTKIPSCARLEQTIFGLQMLNGPIRVALADYGLS